MHPYPSANNFDIDVVYRVDGKASSIEDLKVENKKLMLRKKILLTKQLPAVLCRLNSKMGFDLIKEYLPRVVDEWNPMLIQKQECLSHVCRHLDRTRVLLVAPSHSSQSQDPLSCALDLGRDRESEAG